MITAENFITKQFRISLSNQILIAAVVGILSGILFGNSMRVLAPIGNIYTMLLEVVVYPYIVTTLLSSLGQLSPKLSLQLFKKGWPLYLGLVLLTFVTIFILTKAFPLITSTLKLNPTTSETTLLNMIIPDNLFEALANNYVPAVVLFCILFGIMLQRIKKEYGLFKILDAVSDACVKFWTWLIKFAPIGIFASIAYISGTIQITQIKDVAEYLILFYLGIAIIGFWLIPNLITSLTDIRYRSLFFMLRDALIISVGTTLSILAIPYIAKMTKSLLAKEHIQNPKSKDIVETVLLVSYPFGQIGNFFVYLFILFACIYYNHPLTSLQSWLLPFASYLSSIGSPNTTVSSIAFLAKWLQMPRDITSLYDTVSLVTDYGQVLISVMGFALLSILITFTYFGRIKIQFKNIFFHLVLMGLLLLVFVHIFKTIIPNPNSRIYQRINQMALSKSLTEGVAVSFAPPFDESRVTPVNNKQDSLLRIQKTGVLRVGYNAHAIPFVYFNTQKQLVGYDVANMYALAKSLKSKIEFVPFTWPYLVQDIQGDKFDIAIGGIWAFPTRLETALMTDPYIKDFNVFIVPRNHINDFSDLARAHSIPNLRLAVYQNPFIIRLTQNFFPNAQFFPVLTMEDIGSAFAQRQIDAAMWSQISSNVWVLGHPDYEVVVMPGTSPTFLTGYMLQKNSSQFQVYLNYWLQIKKNEGFATELYNTWIMGQPSNLNASRWSIWYRLRNSHLRQ